MDFKLTPIMEDYLKNIYYIIEEKGKCSIGELAKKLNVTPASVSEMLNKLESKGLIEHQKYQDIKLTKVGWKIALEIIRHHRLIELYLMETLGYDYEKLHIEAEKLEHYVSKELETAIYNFLEKPKFDPHGHPIPDLKGNLPSRDYADLSKLKENDEFIILEVPDNDPQLLKYLCSNDIVPQKTAKIIEKNEIMNYIKLKLEEKEVILNLEVAKKIKVKASGRT